MFRVVYCSRSVATNQDGGIAALLDQILSVARENNARSGITGALLYNDGCFAQVLEAGVAAERLFAKWDMALAEAADPAGAAATLTRALAHPDGSGGPEVVALLDGLVHRD